METHDFPIYFPAASAAAAAEAAAAAAFDACLGSFAGVILVSFKAQPRPIQGHSRVLGGHQDRLGRPGLGHNRVPRVAT